MNVLRMTWISVLLIYAPSEELDRQRYILGQGRFKCATCCVFGPTLLLSMLMLFFSFFFSFVLFSFISSFYFHLLLSNRITCQAKKPLWPLRGVQVQFTFATPACRSPSRLPCLFMHGKWGQIGEELRVWANSKWQDAFVRKKKQQQQQY